MTLLFMDSFAAQDTEKKWAFGRNNGTWVYSTALGRGTGFCMRLAPSFVSTTYQGADNISKTVTASTELIVGFAIYRNSLGGSYNTELIGFWLGAVLHMNIRLTPDGVVQLFRGLDASPVASGGNIVSGRFQYIEVKANALQTGGSVTVKIDGVTVLTYSGDTASGSSDSSLDRVTIGTLEMGNYTSFGGYYITDAYILNTVGSAPFNTFLGDIRIQTSKPNGPGASSGLTPTGSATNWQNVDEVPVSTADYNSSAVVGTKDTYAVEDFASSTGTPLAVQGVIQVRNPDGGFGNAKIVVRSGGVDTAGSTVLATAAGIVATALHPVNPNGGGAWTKSAIDALEIGMEVA